MARFVSSLRFRLVVLVLLAVIPPFGVILYSAAKHRDLTANQVQTNALATARAVAAEQERYFENAHQLLIMLTRLPQVRGNNKLACNRILASLLEPVYVDLGVADPKGSLLCSALPPGTSLVNSNGPHQRRVVETGDFAAGKIRIHSPTGKAILDLGYPMLDSPGVLRGVTLAALDLSWITRITAGNHLAPGATFTLVDNNGTVLFRYPKGREWIGKPIFAEIPSEGMTSRDAERTVQSVGPDGVPRLFAFSQLKIPLGGDTVYAGIDIPAAAAFAEAHRILFHDLIILGALSGLALIAAWFGTDLVVLRRIRDLVSATNQVAAGLLGTRTRLAYGKSELGQMARAFDELAETLEKREMEAEAAANKIQTQRHRQNALYDLNLAITSTLDPTSVLRAILEKISAQFPSCASTVSLINKQTGALDPIAQHNLGDHDQPPTEAATERGLPSIVLKCQSPLVVLNAQLDPRTTNPQFFRHHHLFSYLGLPLIAKGEALGVLSFFNKEERNFGPEEISFLTALVNQAAIAIYNSRLYEQTRNQAVELEKSNKIKDEFLGVMSHELRTPLNIIMNYTEAFRMGMFGEMSQEQERGTDRIRSQAGHLLTLINGILEITKIESGTVTIQKQRVDLADFISEHRSDYNTPMEKDLILEWKCRPDVPAILSDRMKLKQILTNLINNAIKFTEHGSVTISIRILDDGPTLELDVADTGSGIPDDQLPFVFDKFRQIDSTTTRNYSGAGLGLYIVKNFVELFGGTISVESKVGAGSRFNVRLPTTLVNTVTQADCL